MPDIPRYWVDHAVGNDGSAGTENAPFKTFRHAAALPAGQIFVRYDGVPYAFTADDQGDDPIDTWGIPEILYYPLKIVGYETTPGDRVPVVFSPGSLPQTSAQGQHPTSGQSSTMFLYDEARLAYQWENVQCVDADANKRHHGWVNKTMGAGTEVLLSFNNCAAEGLESGMFSWQEGDEAAKHEMVLNGCTLRNCLNGAGIGRNNGLGRVTCLNSLFDSCGGISNYYPTEITHGGLTIACNGQIEWNAFVFNTLFVDCQIMAVLFDYFTKGSMSHCTLLRNELAVMFWGFAVQETCIGDFFDNIFQQNDMVCANGGANVPCDLTVNAFKRFYSNSTWLNTAIVPSGWTWDAVSNPERDPGLNLDGSLTESSAARRTGLAHPAWPTLERASGADDAGVTIEGKGPMTVATDSIGNEVTLEAFQNEDRVLTLTITDADGDPVDLTTGTLVFIVQDMSAVPNEVFRLDGASLVVGGDGKNVLAIHLDGADLETARRDLKWRLWLDNDVEGHGPFWIHPAVSPTES